MEILLLVTARAGEPSAVLPALDLLPHSVRTAPRDVRTLVSGPSPDAATAVAPTRTDDLELAISGMTCASCANRIERRLNKLDGVVATVNYATEKAKVTYPAGMSTDALLEAVEAAGYSARIPQPE